MITFVAKSYCVMKKRIIVLLWAVLVTVSGLSFSEYFRLRKMSQMERNLITTQASLLLNDQLLLEFKRSAMDHYDLLEKENLLMKREGHGGSFEDKTITIYTVYPEFQKRTWQFETEDEWYEYAKEKYGMYHTSGLNLARLDSIFGAALESKGITLPHILAIRDSSNMILEKIPSQVDFNSYQLSTDKIQLDIDKNNFLVACFDASHFGMFRQTRNLFLVSFGIAFLVITLLLNLLYTIFSQMKLAVDKEQFTKEIVHDLRKPVAFIKSILTDIRDGENPKNHVCEMEFENENLSRMIENLLCTSTTNHTQYIHKKSVVLYDYLDEIVNRYKMHDKTIHIAFTYDDPSIKANIDPFHFGFVIMNLIENAIKYSEGNPEILVGCYRKDNDVHITVKDKGIGIPKRYIRQIFKKHYRIPQHESLPRKGLGLGLFYVMIIVNKHGGDVSVKSEYKKGSEFTIIIPADFNINT